MKGGSKTKFLHLPAELDVTPSRFVTVENFDAPVAADLVFERQQRTQDRCRISGIEVLQALLLTRRPIRFVSLLEKLKSVLTHLRKSQSHLSLLVVRLSPSFPMRAAEVLRSDQVRGRETLAQKQLSCL